MRKTSLNAVYNLAKKDKRVVFVGSDLGHGTLDNFKKEMPDRFFMEGVSEQHLIGFMAGLAHSGKIPYFNTIAIFEYRRCLEQVILDLALPNLPVRLLGSGGGFVYVPLGPTHLATDDIAILRTIPNMTIVAPADASEMERLMPQTLNWPGPMYIRLAKGGDPIVTDPKKPFTIGKAIVMTKGRDVALFTTGITLGLALEAAAVLKKKGIHAIIVHVHTIKPIDTKTILSTISNVRVVVSLEEGTIIGGLGSAIAELMVESKFLRPMKRLGLPDLFTEKYGKQLEQMAYYGLNVTNVVKVVSELLKEKTKKRK